MTISKSVSALSLDRYAKIVGLNPVHFSGSGDIELPDGARLFPFSPDFRAYTQNESFDSPRAASREEIGREIHDAESAIEDYLGVHVSPKWVVGDDVPQPMHYSRMYRASRNLRGEGIEIRPKFGEFISGGKRASVELFKDVTVTFEDRDGDGWEEIAVVAIQLDNVPIVFEGEKHNPYISTDYFQNKADIHVSHLSLYDIKVYYDSTNGNPQYEIRPPLSKKIVGNEIVIEFNTWQLINPMAWEALPRDDTLRIEITTKDNIVDIVDVYCEYNDVSQPHAIIIDANDKGYSGHLSLSNPYTNSLNVSAGYWDDTNIRWQSDCISSNAKYIRLNYLSGFRYKPEYELHFWDQLHPELAKLIAYLATTRLSRPLAGRAEVIALSEALQRDKSTSKPGEFLFASNAMLDNPFGTKMGEIYVYDRLQKFQHKFLRYNRE